MVVVNARIEAEVRETVDKEKKNYMLHEMYHKLIFSRQREELELCLVHNAEDVCSV